MTTTLRRAPLDASPARLGHHRLVAGAPADGFAAAGQPLDAARCRATGKHHQPS